MRVIERLRCRPRGIAPTAIAFIWRSPRAAPERTSLWPHEHRSDIRVGRSLRPRTAYRQGGAAPPPDPVTTAQSGYHHRLAGVDLSLASERSWGHRSDHHF